MKGDKDIEASLSTCHIETIHEEPFKVFILLLVLYGPLNSIDASFM